MDIDKLNSVQKSVLVYTAKKYVKTDEQESAKKEDTLTLTEEAQRLLDQRKESKGKQQKNTRVIELKMLAKQLAKSNKKENKTVNMSKCFKIAARIGNGDKVPFKDMKFLRENAPELYKNALLFKRHNPEPKKYKSCLNKEDERASANRQNATLNASTDVGDTTVSDFDV